MIPPCPDTCNRPVRTWLSHPPNVPACISVDTNPYSMYDRSVNSSSSFPAQLQETISPSFVCSFFPWHIKLTHNLVFNVDSGHSDQQPSFDEIEEEEDGQDEGMLSLILP